MTDYTDITNPQPDADCTGCTDGSHRYNGTLMVSQDYRLREVAGEHIIIPVGQAAITFNGLIAVNGVALSIWKLLQKGASFGEIVDGICAEYEVDAQTAAADLTEFLDTLQENGLLEESIG